MKKKSKEMNNYTENVDAAHGGEKQSDEDKKKGDVACEGEKQGDEEKEKGDA